MGRSLSLNSLRRGGTIASADSIVTHVDKLYMQQLLQQSHVSDSPDKKKKAERTAVRELTLGGQQ